MPPQHLVHLVGRQCAERPAAALALCDPARWGDPRPPPSLTLGRAHEICGPARLVLAAMIAGRVAAGGMGAGPVLWIRPAHADGRLNPDGLARFFDPGRLVLARPERAADALWLAEEALRSGAVPLVIVDLAGPPALTPVRRLHLAAQAGAEAACAGLAPLALLLCPGQGGAQGIETRWSLTAAPGPGVSAAPLCERSTCDGGACERRACEGRVCEGTVCDERSCEGGACEARACEARACEGAACEGTTCEGRACDAGACDGRACGGTACEARPCNAGACQGAQPVTPARQRSEGAPCRCDATTGPAPQDAPCLAPRRACCTGSNDAPGDAPGDALGDAPENTAERATRIAAHERAVMAGRGPIRPRWTLDLLRARLRPPTRWTVGWGAAGITARGRTARSAAPAMASGSHRRPQDAALRHL